MPESDAAAVGIHAIAQEAPEGVLDTGLLSHIIFVLERLDVAGHLRRKRLVNFPKSDIVEFQPVPREQPRDGCGGGHEQPFVEDINRGHLEIEESHAWRRPRKPRQARIGRNPDRCRAIGERRAVAGGERAAAACAVKGGLQPGELLQRSVAARKVILRNPVDRNDQIGKKAAIARRYSALMAFKRELILLPAANVPGLRHVLGVLTHASSGDAVLHLGHEQADIGGPQLSQNSKALTEIARLREAPQPIG